MTNLMMLSRELKRVPLDFDAPIDKIWQPRLERPKLPPCDLCGPALAAAERREWNGAQGDGFTAEYRQLEQTWYALFTVGGEEQRHALQWVDKLGQHEVDALTKAHRFDPVIACPKGCKTPEERGVKGGEPWKTDCPECQGRGWTREEIEVGSITAAEVNEAERKGTLREGFGHDGLNRHIAIEARCELLGFETTCPRCEGSGTLGTEEERKAHEEWEMPDPPEGEGYQLWQSISEGGPVSPVFATPEELAKWLADGYTVANRPFSEEEWMEVLKGEAMAFEVRSGKLA